MDRRSVLAGLLAGASLWAAVPALGQSTNGAPKPTPKPSSNKAPKPPPKRVVALDAGHGGKDPGAIGVRGTYEKDITFAVARALAQKLDSTGRYTVRLTRDDDSFVPLAERVRIARSARAELFLSLHADSGGNPHRRGYSVYTLAERASDDLASALAQRENDVDRFAGIDMKRHTRQVRTILLDLMQRETTNHSAAAAHTMVETLQPRFTPLEKPLRQANFAVLRAPDIPSLLVEMGFLSNLEDEKLLTQKATQGRLVERLNAALDAYFAAAV
jgi:N-acetylmuramoyl-L-alanine amidase